MRHEIARAVAVSVLLALAPSFPTHAAGARERRDQDKARAAAAVVRGEAALKAGNLADAETAFRQAVEGDPPCAAAYAGLAAVAQRRGDVNAQIDWARKASIADRRNLEYALAWARALAARYPAARLTFDIPEYQAMPADTRLAQMLSALADEAAEPADAQAFLEQYRDRFGQAPSAMMMRLCEAYWASDRARAIRFAETVAKAARPGDYYTAPWSDFLTILRNLARADDLISRRQFAEAGTLLDATRPLSSGMAIPVGLTGELTVAKANAVAGAGDAQAAYQLATEAFASAPTEPVRQAIERFAAATNRSTTQVAEDLRERLARDAELAPDFAIPTYADGRTVSLSALRGKVVLLNFWFPT